jgi:hypothetical protein
MNGKIRSREQRSHKIQNASLTRSDERGPQVLHVYIYVLGTNIHVQPSRTRPPQLTSSMVLADISMAERGALDEMQFTEGCQS